jgi:hypothetical protein
VAGADVVPPRYVHVPDCHTTLGPEVAAVATLAGFPPDPEQQLLLDAAFAIDKRGKSVAFAVVVVAPRQNLKTGFLKQYALGQLFVRDERLVPWTAHEFGTAAEALEDMEALIDGSDVLRKRVKLTTRGQIAKHGAVPEIRLLSGARLIFKTRTAGGGRGLSGRKVILDEGFALQSGQVGALMPIMLAQPDPQVVIASSACRPESAVLWEYVQVGRAGRDARTAYFEWATPPPEQSCDRGKVCDHQRTTPGCGCDKPELIRTAHSAVSRGRIQLQSLVDLRTSMPPDEYAREIMGWHDEPDAGTNAVDYDVWVELADQGPRAVDFFAVAVSLERDWTAIAAVGERPDGLIHVEVIEHRPGSPAWLVDRGAELSRKYGAPFVVDARGPASTEIDELEQAGVVVLRAETKDVADAYALLVDAVRDRTIRHVDAAQSGLNDAARTARTRPCGDNGTTLGRRKSGTDITPLEAVQLGHWAAVTRPSIDILQTIW